ncbi:MAG: hypothetical protein JXR50_10630, partial [Prolixibacteraceae bacterium]|nr:hypothetical protein [Prolixibacteraceae bacterium]MBN2650182.1 hypothetical protein [Prolixibacteraceae bacterium]
WYSNEMMSSGFPFLLYDAQKLENAEALMGAASDWMNNIEKLGIHSNAILGSQINGNLNSGELLRFMDSEQFQAVMIICNAEQLEFTAGGF